MRPKFKPARRTGDRTRGHAGPASAPGLRLIAGFKLVQGLLLALVGTGLLLMVKTDPDTEIARWLAALQVDTDSPLSRTLLARLDAVSPPQLQHLGMGAFLYAVLLFTEGTGLLLRKRWAEIVTVVVTASFLPLELHEVIRRVTVAGVAVLIANGVAVWYVVNVLRHKKEGAGPDGRQETAAD